MFLWESARQIEFKENKNKFKNQIFRKTTINHFKNSIKTIIIRILLATNSIEINLKTLKLNDTSAIFCGKLKSKQVIKPTNNCNTSEIFKENHHNNNNNNNNRKKYNENRNKKKIQIEENKNKIYINKSVVDNNNEDDVGEKIIQTIKRFYKAYCERQADQLIVNFLQQQHFIINSNNRKMTATTTTNITPFMVEFTANEHHHRNTDILIKSRPFTTAATITIDSNNSNSSIASANNILENITTNAAATTTTYITSLYNDTSDNDDYDSDSEVLRTIEYIGTVLSFYYVPIIVGTGSIGNILSVFVFFKTKLSKLSSSFYLAALAVSDTCFLLGLFAQWLNFVDIHIYNREYFCQFFTFFSNLACFCSVWFVVAFTVERFIAVMYPLRRQTMCTVRRAKIVLVGLTILGCLHCAPFWISSTPVYSPKLETTICDIKSEYKYYIRILNYWDTIVVFAVPFTTIAVLNTFTGCTVWKFATVRRTLTMQKMKTQHLPLHATMSSPSSSCSARETGPMTMAKTATASSAESSAATMTTTTTATMTQQAIATYRITTSSSLKRQKSTLSSGMQLNGGHQHHHEHLHNLQQQDVHHHRHHRLHSHPNRATMIKHATSGINDYEEIFSRKSRRKKVTNSSQLKVTKMLLIVSTVFVCLNLPSFIMRMITYLETQSSTNEKTTVVLQYIFQLLFITNFGINFVLYCVSGQNFRKAVLSMFRKVSTKQRDGATQLTVSEYCRNSGGGMGGGCSAYTSSTRKRMMNQNCWNEIHELQRLK